MALNPEKMDSSFSWIICVLSFVAHALTYGVYVSFGTIFVAIIKEYNVGEEEAAWVGSISFSVSLLGGIITSAMCRRFGCRPTACAGAVLYGIGLVSSSFAPTLTVWYLTYGILFALGTSAVYMASVLIIGQHFEMHYAVATGIAGSGIGFGGLCNSRILEVLIETYGLRFTLRILASLSIILFIIGLTYGGRSQKRNIEIKLDSTSGSPQKKSKFIDFNVWKNGAFIIWTIVICVVYFVIYIPYVHLVRLAMDLNISQDQASLLLGYGAIAQSVGKIVFGKLSDNQRVNRLYLAQVSLLIVGICHTLCPILQSYILLIVYTLVYGLFDGSFQAMAVILCGDIVGKENLASALGSLFLMASLSTMFGPPFAAFLYTSTGSYDSAFFLCGGVIALAACIMFGIPWFVPQSTAKYEDKPSSTMNDMDDINSNESYMLSSKDKEFTSISLDSGIEISCKEESSISSISDGTDKHGLITHMDDSSSSSSVWTELFNKHLKKLQWKNNSRHSVMLYPYIDTSHLNEILVVVDKVTMV